ncbi:MAG: hypothetical protein H6724_00750 [Sandaracinus sp.]|nr:hypothetical protein [Sandaracinus sp.]
MRTLFLLLFTALVACGDDDVSTPADASTPTDGGPDLRPDVGVPLDGGTTPTRFEVIEERSVTVLDVARRVELVRATRSDGARTYLAYVHAVSEPAPVVVLNQPYAGIDWTGEDVDARWAALGNGLHPDVDAPAYDGDDVIAYGAQTVQAAADETAVWLLNGAAAVHVYARYYAGGSLMDDALDAATAYDFVASRSDELRVDRIGSYGGSWGGMMAVFGAAFAGETRPLVVSAIAPPTDFVDLYQHTHVELPELFPEPDRVEAFFSTYWRRADPSIGFPPAVDDPRVRAFTDEGLCETLSPGVFLLHDDWDLLIPTRQSEALAARCPEKVSATFWRRGTLDYDTTPLDHGPFGGEPVFPTVQTFATLRILHPILDEAAPRLSLGHVAAFEAFLGLVRDARTAGEDVSWALSPLRDVADARVRLFDPSTEEFRDGADVLADAFASVFGGEWNAASVRTQLETGLP